MSDRGGKTLSSRDRSRRDHDGRRVIHRGLHGAERGHDPRPRRRNRNSDALPDLLKEPDHKKPLWVRVLFIGAAAVAFVLGVIGWLLPVVTGIPFYVLGLCLLAFSSDRVRVWINRLDRRFSTKTRLKIRRALRKMPFKGLRAAIADPGTIG